MHKRTRKAEQNGETDRVHQNHQTRQKKTTNTKEKREEKSHHTVDETKRLRFKHEAR